MIATTSKTAKSILEIIGVVEGRSLWRLAPEHVDLVAKNQDLRFTPCAGLDQPNKRTTKQSEQVDHWAPASPDSPQFASCMAYFVPEKVGEFLDRAPAHAKF
jgi:hypothetical protein